MIYLGTNFFNADTQSDIFHRQQLCIQSTSNIRDYIYITSFLNDWKDVESCPYYAKVVKVTRDAKTELNHPRGNLFIRDILANLYEQTDRVSDWIGFFNVDVIFPTDFFDRLHDVIKNDLADSVLSTSSNIGRNFSNTLDNCLKAKQIYNYGFDMIMFHVKNYDMVMSRLPDLLMGEIRVDDVLGDILTTHTNYEKIYGYTRHILHPKVWRSNTEGKKYNMKLSKEYFDKLKN